MRRVMTIRPKEKQKEEERKRKGKRKEGGVVQWLKCKTSPPE